MTARPPFLRDRAVGSRLTRAPHLAVSRAPTTTSRPPSSGEQLHYPLVPFSSLRQTSPAFPLWTSIGQIWLPTSLHKSSKTSHKFFVNPNWRKPWMECMLGSMKFS
ncbi:hypothetical protein J5N97_028229 [Dioscorea zingiberensis]|uniref:Uncharacterized protein n=1 Tax=Dioscorea zingiberensis TaxID=325984 RepID=A0A9D5H4P8_9LILI|nr:hypothetical protein J5N97_028229 [Dioscorea zingiberensis]